MKHALIALGLTGFITWTGIARANPRAKSWDHYSCTAPEPPASWQKSSECGWIYRLAGRRGINGNLAVYQLSSSYFVNKKEPSIVIINCEEWTSRIQSKTPEGYIRFSNKGKWTPIQLGGFLDYNAQVACSQGRPARSRKKEPLT